MDIYFVYDSSYKADEIFTDVVDSWLVLETSTKRVVKHTRQESEETLLTEVITDVADYEKYFGDGYEAKRERFVYVFDRLGRTFPDVYKDIMKDPTISSLRWFRNEALLWPGYEETDSWLSEDGCTYDPLHPDNFSNFMFESYVRMKTN